MVVLVKILIAVNLLTFALYGIDKWKACHHRWRIPVSTLLLFAACGGSVGALLGMYLFRHKTRKNRFRFGIPVLLAAQIALACLLYRYGFLAP